MSAQFAAIPCLQDGVARFEFGHECHRRAGAVDEDDLLACAVEHGERRALSPGQLDAGAVATLESFFVDAHLLALELGRDTTYEDDGLRIANLCEQLLIARGHLVLYVESEEGEVTDLYVVDLQAVVLSCLDLHLLLCALDAVAHLPDVDDRVAVDDEAHFVVGIDVEDDGLVARGYECRVESCREVLQVDAWGKDGVAAVAEHDGRCDVGGGSGFALHLRIIIIGGLHASAAERVPQFAEAALEDLVAGQSAAADVACLWCQALDAFEGSDGARGKARVVTPLHD